MDLYSVVCVRDRDAAARWFGVFFGRPPDEVIGEEHLRLATHGIHHEPVETYGNGVRHVVVLDPDGNSLALAEPPAQ